MHRYVFYHPISRKPHTDRRPHKLQTVTPLRLEVEIFSGISPPATLPSSVADPSSASISPPLHAPAYDTLSSLPIHDVGNAGTDASLPSYADAVADSHEPPESMKTDENSFTDLKALALEKGKP